MIRQLADNIDGPESVDIPPISFAFLYSYQVNKLNGGGASVHE